MSATRYAIAGMALAVGLSAVAAGSVQAAPNGSEAGGVRVESQGGTLQRESPPSPASAGTGQWQPVAPNPPQGEANNGAPVFQLDIGVQQQNNASGGTSDRNDRSGQGAQPGTGVGNGNGAGRSGNQVGTGVGNGDGPGIGTTAGNGSRVNGAPGAPNGGQPSRTIRYIPSVTGLIVDARELDFVPSMSMRLFDPEGNQIYTTLNSNRNLNTYQVAANGTAAYATSEAQARSLVQRVGERPTVITPEDTRGYDLIVSSGDAWKLSQQNERDRFLENFAVVVIWNPSVVQ